MLGSTVYIIYPPITKSVWDSSPSLSISTSEHLKTPDRQVQCQNQELEHVLV